MYEKYIIMIINTEKYVIWKYRNVRSDTMTEFLTESTKVLILVLFMFEAQHSDINHPRTSEVAQQEQ